MKIDWEKLWIEERKGSPLMKYRKDIGTEMWDKSAEDYRDSINKDAYGYGRKIIEVIEDIIKPDFEVLDIGAGPGTLAVPLARLVARVIALDPSREMLKVLEESAVREGIANIDTQNKTWQEVNDAEVKEKFDLVIASNVLWMFEDVGTQLMRIHNASRGYCCVVFHAGLTDDLDSELWFKIMREEYNFGVDYIYIYNILYNKGIYANVNVIDYVYTFEKKLNEAIEYYEYLFDMYTEITPRVKKIIRDYISDNAVDDVYCKKSQGKNAVIWWKR